MRKVYIKESSIRSIEGKKRLLPKHLYDMVKSHSTSLGDNNAFPKVGDYPYDYTILKKGYFNSIDKLGEFGVSDTSEEWLVNRLSELVGNCKRLENPIKENLEKACENMMIELFSLPSEIVELNCKIVGKVTPKKGMRMMPEEVEESDYSFDDIAHIDLSEKEVGKRRFINSLIQGGANSLYYETYDLCKDEWNVIDAINGELRPLYDEILAINDALLFIKKDKLSDEHPMQGSYVEVHLGSDGSKSVIESQGLIFPLLVRETIRGFLELISTHGLPKDRKEAMYVIRKSDFVLAEPWDMRFGKVLWDSIFSKVVERKSIPYVFNNIVSLELNEFNDVMNEILANTKKGNSIVREIESSSIDDMEYLSFTSRMKEKDASKGVIADDCFSPQELDDVIEEDGSIDGYESCSIGILATANENDIDFEAEEFGGLYRLKVQVGECSFTQDDGISLLAEPKDSIQENSYQLHIEIDDRFRGMGIATKLYEAFLLKCGDIVSLYGNRVGSYAKEVGMTKSEDSAIDKIFAKLSQIDEITVEALVHNGKQVGVIAYKNV